jgi:copper homeostasis protein
LIETSGRLSWETTSSEGVQQLPEHSRKRSKKARMQLEICLDSVESAIAAQDGGAQRVELCSALSEAGLTPSIGLIRAVRKAIHIGLHVMIRPRGGDFLYSDHELDVMREDILRAAECGADGVVFGLLTPDGDVDLARTRELVELARPMEVTFHRAIDMARDSVSALQDVIQSGAVRILTSGGAQSALQGASRIEEMVRAAGDSIHIMVCGGVRAETVQEIVANTGASQFHAAVRQETGSKMTYRPEHLHLGTTAFEDYSRKVVMSEDVKRLRSALDALA